MNIRNTLIGATAVWLLCEAATVSAAFHGTLPEDLSSTRPLVYTSGYVYAKGFKISRPGAVNDGGFPAGSIAVIANDGPSASPGLGVNRLDWGAAVQDYSRAAWRIDIDNFARGFTAHCAAPPNAPLSGAATCWVRAYDYYGTLLAETHATRLPTDTGPTALVLDYGSMSIKYLLLSADLDLRDAHSPGVDWGNFVTLYYPDHAIGTQPAAAPSQGTGQKRPAASVREPTPSLRKIDSK